MPLRILSYMLNRLLLLGLIALAIKALVGPSDRVDLPWDQYLSSVSPFDQIARALK